jgi:tetratricopeptide (TPR) repeat protein
LYSLDLDAVDDDYNTNSIQNSNSSDDAQLHDEIVDNVEQTVIENGSITDYKIASAEQLLILGRSCQTEGRNEEAIKSYEQAVQIADEVDHNDIKAKAYQHLGNVFTGTSEYKKAIEYYQKARKISPRLEGDEMEVIAYQRLGYNHLQAGMYKESIEYHKEVIKLASQLGDKKRSLTLNAYLGLGSAFSYTDDFEFSRKYFLKALTVAEQMNDKALQKEAYTNLGYVYYQSCMFDAAVESYLKVQEISHDLGDRKEEANACLMLGDTFQELKRHKKATESYQTTLDISGELEDKEMQVVAIQSLATLFLTLASICSKDFDCDRAIEWYKKALDILGTEPSDHLLHEKALTGLGVAWFNLGDTEKAMESIHEAQNVAKNTDTGIVITHCYILWKHNVRSKSLDRQQYTK